MSILSKLSLRTLLRVLVCAVICSFAFGAEGYAKKNKKKKSKSYQLAACLFFQDEAPYLKEWIEYHLLIGFEHFYLFNNESTDDYKAVLAPYIKKGIVELENIPGISNNQSECAAKQYRAYNRALAKARGKVKWLALIDADEFIVPVEEDRLLDVLKEYEMYGGVYINWLMFGTSGHQTIPKGRLMIETLTYGLPWVENLGKSIVRPERVSLCSDAHRMFYHPPYIHVNTDHETFDAICPRASDKLIINHYYTRDIDHLVNVKFPRRRKWQPLELEEYKREVDKLNVVRHKTILRFVPALRKKIYPRSHHVVAETFFDDALPNYFE